MATVEGCCLDAEARRRTTGLRLLATDYGLLTTGTTDHGPETTDHRPRTTDYGPQTTDHRDHGPRTTDHRPQTTGSVAEFHVVGRSSRAGGLARSSDGLGGRVARRLASVFDGVVEF